MQDLCRAFAWVAGLPVRSLKEWQQETTVNYSFLYLSVPTQQDCVLPVAKVWLPSLFVVVRRKRLRSILPTMLIVKKSCMGVNYACVLVFSYSYGAPLSYFLWTKSNTTQTERYWTSELFSFYCQIVTRTLQMFNLTFSDNELFNMSSLLWDNSHFCTQQVKLA